MIRVKTEDLKVPQAIAPLNPPSETRAHIGLGWLTTDTGIGFGAHTAWGRAL